VLLTARSGTRTGRLGVRGRGRAAGVQVAAHHKGGQGGGTEEQGAAERGRPLCAHTGAWRSWMSELRFNCQRCASCVWYAWLLVVLPGTGWQVAHRSFVGTASCLVLLPSQIKPSSPLPFLAS